MSDVDSGAAAPADAGGVPIEANTPQTQPLGSQTPVAEKPEVAPEKPAAKETDDKPSKTAGEAVRKAFAELKNNPPDKAEKGEKAAQKSAEGKSEARPETKPEPKAETKPEQPRDNGRFASPNPKPEGGEQRAQTSEAPSRFSEDAKRDWQTAPESVRRESERAIRELTQGIEKHKPAAEAYEKIKQFDELAKNSGTDLPTALSRYVNMEAMLRQNPLKGLEAICENIGVSLRDVAAHVMGQTPDQQQSQSDATIRELRQELASLKQQVGGVQQTFAQQREASTLKEIETFAASKPRFEELASDIAFFLQSGRTSDIGEAYELAERLNPSAKAAPAVETPLAQTQRAVNGTKSISGAPAAGSDPQYRKPASSNREALQRAFARVS